MRLKLIKRNLINFLCIKAKQQTLQREVKYTEGVLSILRMYFPFRREFSSFIHLSKHLLKYHCSRAFFSVFFFFIRLRTYSQHLYSVGLARTLMRLSRQSSGFYIMVGRSLGRQCVSLNRFVSVGGCWATDPSCYMTKGPEQNIPRKFLFCRQQCPAKRNQRLCKIVYISEIGPQICVGCCLQEMLRIAIII